MVSFIQIINSQLAQFSYTAFFKLVWSEAAATGGVLWKKVFLKIKQSSQEKPCVRVPFLIKRQAWGLQLY